MIFSAFHYIVLCYTILSMLAGRQCDGPGGSAWLGPFPGERGGWEPGGEEGVGMGFVLGSWRASSR